MTQTMFALVQPEAEDRRYAPLCDAARAIHQQLLRQGAISRQHLQKLMTRGFDGTDAIGAWSMRDAYEALEAAQVFLLGQPDCRLLTDRAPTEQFRAVQVLERALPTQTYRSERQVDLQQFSTPLSLAWLAAQAAQIKREDVVLEPSAGTGMLAVYGKRAGARLILNERDPQRAALLADVLATVVTEYDAEHINDLAAPSPRPTVVLINPPFSRSADRGVDRHAGARHLRSALLRLAPGGRCVAIMSPGFARGNTGGPGYEAVCEVVPPRVEIDIGGSPYAKHGTSIDIRLLVFDKGWSAAPAQHRVADIAAAVPIVLALPSRPAPDEPPPAPLVANALSRLPTRTSAQGLLRGLAATPLIAPAPQSVPTVPVMPLDYSVRDAVPPAGDPSGIYAPWRLARIDIDGAAPHPDALVESLAMASVPPPAPRYRPYLPERTVRALSDAQLEVIIQAGDAFSRDLPGRFSANASGDNLIENENGAPYRTGFYIGDGTGVGKGREAAGCIMDQWCQGRRKAIYLSKSSALEVEAKRDWTALGGLSIDIQGLDGIPLGAPIPLPAGILFCTYATLRSQRNDQASRLQQILDWVGPDFDGIIVLDEAHALANAAGTETQFGAAKGSEQGLAGVRLQNALPRARILYLSATGATDPANLCYASRLGLWGSGTAFPDRNAFMRAMEEGGIAAMEIVARDLKAMGLYTARALSFAGVEYEALEHPLTADQITIYDAYADAWAIIHRNLGEVLKASGIVDRMTGDVLNAQARGSALSRFESSKQRFFSALLVALKMPTLIKAIETEIDRGHAAVVQLVTTAEAILDRRLANMSDDERAALDLELSPLDTLIEYLRSGFPIRQMRTFRTDSGDLRSELMVDEEGNPVHCREAIRARDDLIEQLCSMPAVPSALDSLLRHFGTDVVAEVTGRSRRIVVDSAGRQKLERRSERASIADADAFQDGRKNVLVFSDAGGTGRSYHAERSAKSAGKRRIHFLLEPGWRAAAAVQGLGRTHRTNQTVPPVFRPVTTDCKGERRFISTIARRLDSLGALTRGQRQTGGQNLFDPADNLESDFAKEALTQWYHLLHSKKLASTTLGTFIDMTGLKLINADDGSLLEHLPPIQRWLNRILALRIATQNAIFEEYLGLIQARIDAAREAGTLDVGVETILAEKMVQIDDRLLRRDPVTGAETRLQRLELHIKRHATSHARLMTGWSDTPDIACLWNVRSGRVALRVPSWSVTDEEGRIVPTCRLIRPTGSDRIDAAVLYHSHWSVVDADTFRVRWDKEAAEAQDKVDIETISIATGLLLPVWHKLPADDVRVWRVSDGTGNSMLGRIVPDHAIDTLASAFGIDAELRLNPDQIVAAAKGGSGALIPELGAARLVTALVNGQRRLEIRDFPAQRRDWLKSLGCFVEIIAYKTRLFVPVDRAAAIIDKIARSAN